MMIMSPGPRPGGGRGASHRCHEEMSTRTVVAHSAKNGWGDVMIDLHVSWLVFRARPYV